MASFHPASDSTFWQGTLLAACGGRSVVAWDVSGGGKHHVTLNADENVNSLQWSGNNKVLAYAGQKGAVALYNQEKYMGGIPNATTRVKALAEINALRFSRDSKKLYVGCVDGGIFVWDLKLQDLVNTFSEHKAPITSLCVSPNDSFLAAACSRGSLMLHSCSSKGPATVVSAGGGVGTADRRATKHSLVFSPLEPGLLAAVCDDLQAVCLWDLGAGVSGTSFPTQRLPQCHKGAVSSVCFAAAASPSSAALLYSCGADGNVVAWDRRAEKAAQLVSLSTPLRCLSTRDDGVHLAIGSDDGQLFVMDLRKASAPACQLQALSTAVSELHWQSSQRSSRRSASGTTASKPAATASATGKPQGTASNANPTTSSLSSWIAPNAAAAASTPVLKVHAAGHRGLEADKNSPMDITPQGVKKGGSKADSATATANAAAAPTASATHTGAPSASGSLPPRLSTSQPSTSVAEPLLSPASDHRQAGASAAAAMRPSTRQLSETVFRHYMDDTIGGVHEGTRNLQIEMIRQFHLQQVEMMGAINSIVSRQEEIQSDMRLMKSQMEQLMRRQRDPAAGMGGW